MAQTVIESACNAGDPGLIPESARSPGEGIGYPLQYSWASLLAQIVKNPPAMRETWAQSWIGRIPWRRAWQPTPVLLPGESCGQKHLEGHSPWGHRELDTPERLSKQSICFRQTALAHLIDSTDCTAEAPFLSALGNQKVGTAHLLQHSCCDLKWSLQDLQGGTGSFMRL